MLNKEEITIMTTKTYDNSRAGNDCWIYEYWYWCEPLKVAICVAKAVGWGNEAVSTNSYERANNWVPVEVQSWFAEDEV